MHPERPWALFVCFNFYLVRRRSNVKNSDHTHRPTISVFIHANDPYSLDKKALHGVIFSNNETVAIALQDHLFCCLSFLLCTLPWLGHAVEGGLLQVHLLLSFAPLMFDSKCTTHPFAHLCSLNTVTNWNNVELGKTTAHQHTCSWTMTTMRTTHTWTIPATIVAMLHRFLEPNKGHWLHKVFNIDESRALSKGYRRVLSCMYHRLHEISNLEIIETHCMSGSHLVGFLGAWRTDKLVRRIELSFQEMSLTILLGVIFDNLSKVSSVHTQNHLQLSGSVRLLLFFTLSENYLS